MKNWLLVILTIGVLSQLSNNTSFDISFPQDELQVLSNDSPIPGFYIEQSFHENDRVVRTPDFNLDAGFYNVTITYENNISPDAHLGCRANFHAYKNDYEIIAQKEDILLTSDASPRTFQVFVPYNNTSAYVSAFLEGDDVLALDPSSDTKYLLVREISVSKDTTATKNYCIKIILSYFVILVFVLSALWFFISNKKHKSRDHISQ